MYVSSGLPFWSLYFLFWFYLCFSRFDCMRNCFFFCFFLDSNILHDKFFQMKISSFYWNARTWKENEWPIGTTKCQLYYSWFNRSNICNIEATHKIQYFYRSSIQHMKFIWVKTLDQLNNNIWRSIQWSQPVISRDYSRVIWT